MIEYQEDKISRLNAIQKHFKLNQKNFASRIGLTQSKVSLIYNGKAGANILNEIFYRLNFEFGISKEWWEFGTGEMINSSIYSQNEIQQNIVSEKEGNYNDDYWHGRYDELLRQFEILKNELAELKRNK